MTNRDETYATALPFKKAKVRGEGQGGTDVESFEEFVLWCRRYKKRGWWHSARAAASARYIVPCWTEGSGTWTPVGFFGLRMAPRRRRCQGFPTLNWFYETSTFTAARSGGRGLKVGRGYRQVPFSRAEFERLKRGTLSRS